MSILINMEMPKSCEDCPLIQTAENYYGDVMSQSCNLIYKGYLSGVPRGERRKDCPLVEIPDGHGRLIDADVLMHEIDKAESVMEKHGREYACSFLSTSQEISTEWYCVEEMVDNAPTVIPADKDGGT